MPQSHGGGGALSDDHRNLRDAISTLTHHLTGLGKDGASDRGAAIVTLAGSNKGAVMKADLLEEAMEAADAGEEAKLNAYANSNYQAVNNSIMIDGQCEAEDPGVRIEIVDCVEGDDGEKDDDSDVESKKKKKEKEEKKKKEKKEKKKKEKKEKKKGSSNEEEEGKRGSDRE